MKITHTPQQAHWAQAHAYQAPHNCNVPDCPGRENKRKLELFDELLSTCQSLLYQQNTIEALGEWEATDTNWSDRKKERAKVDATNLSARDVIARAKGEK